VMPMLPLTFPWLRLSWDSLRLRAIVEAFAGFLWLANLLQEVSIAGLLLIRQSDERVFSTNWDWSELIHVIVEINKAKQFFANKTKSVVAFKKGCFGDRKWTWI